MRDKCAPGAPVVARSPDTGGTTKQSQSQPLIDLWDGHTAESIVTVFAKAGGTTGVTQDRSRGHEKRVMSEEGVA